jgi:EpsI family protein
MQRGWRHYCVAVGILALAVPVPGYLARQQKTPLRQPLSELSYEIGRWDGRDQHLSERVRAVLGTEDILLREYSDQGRLVWLYVSYFPHQQQGQASHSPKNCLPGGGWQPVRSRRLPYPLAAHGIGTINEILYEKDGQQQLVFYWFRERDRIVASEYLVKGYLVWDAITRSRTDGALLRVSTPVGQSEEEARQDSLDFMRTVLPHLDELFPK